MNVRSALNTLKGVDTGVLSSLVRAVGVRGGIRSLSASINHTGDPFALVLSKNTRACIDESADLNIGSVFIVGLKVGSPSSYWLGGSTINVSSEATIDVGDEDSAVRIGPASTINVQGELSVGGGSYVHSSGHITVHEKVSIGRSCAIARGFSVRDADVHDLLEDGNVINEPDPVVIGDNVWIGSEVSVKKGVTIGDGAVVASRSVVTDDVPAGSLVAGVPAEVVRDHVAWRY